MFLSHTKINGHFVFRLVIGQTEVTADDVRQAWDNIRSVAIESFAIRPFKMLFYPIFCHRYCKELATASSPPWLFPSKTGRGLTLPITFSVTDGESFKFHYPLRAKLFKSERGALQGAVHWEAEEQAPAEFQIPAAGQPVTTNIGVTGKCDYVNRDDGSCCCVSVPMAQLVS